MLRSRYYGYNEGPKLRPTGVSQNSALKMVANAWRINIVINIRRPLKLMKRNAMVVAGRPVVTDSAFTENSHATDCGLL